MRFENIINTVQLGDCYELIKDIPDNSIDLVIIDPPYKFVSSGVGNSEIAQRKNKQKDEIYLLDTDISKERKRYQEYMLKNGKDKESERLRVIANAIDNKNNISLISKGFTNEILNELIRTMKKINIYIWCNKNQLRQIIDYFDDLNCNIDLLTWHKTNPIPTCNNTYLSDT